MHPAWLRGYRCVAARALSYYNIAAQDLRAGGLALARGKWLENGPESIKNDTKRYQKRYINRYFEYRLSKFPVGW
jgi:hypothetical protein